MVASALGIASAASAHPGHGAGGTSFSAVHYLTEPVHVFGIFVSLAAVAAGGWLWKRRRARAL